MKMFELYNVGGCSLSDMDCLY